MNLFDQAFDLLMRPGHTVTSALSAGLKGENVLGGAWKGLSRQERVGYGDILREQGVPEGPGRTIAGLAGDIALDPLSYIGTGPVKAAGAITVKGVAKAVTKAGLEKAGAITERLGTALKGAISTMPEAKLLSTAERAARQAPEARTLLRGLSPAELRSPEAVKAMTAGLARPYIGKALEKTPGLVAENAIKFAGIPLVKTATIGKAAKAVLEGAKKIPILGKGVQLAETVAQKGAGAARRVFSSKTGIPELDAAVTSARDLRNVGQTEAGEFAGQRIKDIAKIAKPGTPGYKEAQHEVIRTIEGVPVKKVVTETKLVSTKPRLIQAPKTAPYVPTGRVLPHWTTPEAKAALEAGQPFDTSKVGVHKMQTEGAHLAPIPAVYLSLDDRAWGYDWTKIGGKKLERVNFEVHPSAKIYTLSEYDDMKRLKAEFVAAETARRPHAPPNPHFGNDDRRFWEWIAKNYDAVEIKHPNQFGKWGVGGEAPQMVVLNQKMLKVIPEAKVAGQAIPIPSSALPSTPITTQTLVESRAPYTSPNPKIAPIAAKLKERTAGILKAEGPTLNLPPQERSFYLPHYMKPEIEGLLKTNPSSILKDNAPSVSNVLRRANRKGILEFPVDDLIHGGMIDPDKYDKLLKAKGAPGLTADERLIFDADPVKAVLKREVGSVRARAASEMRDEIIHSDSFLKSKVDLRSPAGVTEADAQLATHPGHSLYVTTKDWIAHGMDDAGREALRQGKNRALLNSMMVKIDSPEQIAKFAGKTGRVDGFVLPDEIVGHLNAAYTRDFMDEKVADFIRNVYDPALGWWKAFTTVVRPGFNSRNGISNLWQMFLAGAKNPADLGTAGMLQRAAATGKWGKLAPIAGYTDREIYKLAREMGMVKSGQLGQGVERFVEDAANPSRNPLSRRGPLVRVGSAVAGTVEDNAKLALFIDGLKKGMDPKSSAMRVKKYLFDYSDISSFEQKYLKRLLPFYVWSRKNLPLALETLLKQPGKVALLPKAMQAADKDVDGLDRPVVADWINKSLGIPIKKNEDGTVSYVLMGGLIPTADLARMDTKQLVSMLSPIIKAPIEQLMNEDWFRGKPIVNFPGEMVQFMGVPMPARMAHLVRNLVIVAQVDRGFFQDDRDFLQGMSNLLTGIRTYKQDPVRQLKSYFLHQQKEAGMLENQAERQEGKTSLLGESTVKDQLLARAEQLRGRGETARKQALEISPTAFDVKRKPRPQLAPTSMQQFKARIKAQVAKMSGRKKAL